ncbi:hypothetical protein chiPu_0004200 [Chiloscyllium punctatum]|uniref:Uncharacterized protein n=1 Tax=Chiloscyllium punctatum TaxID=137246 RepID=A0A401S5X4_CHIPU|nr:hypothetical protein [Chiloscyllium punctatum]
MLGREVGNPRIVPATAQTFERVRPSPKVAARLENRALEPENPAPAGETPTGGHFVSNLRKPTATPPRSKFPGNCHRRNQNMKIQITLLGLIYFSVCESLKTVSKRHLGNLLVGVLLTSLKRISTDVRPTAKEQPEINLA